jgi:putative ABC transport system permease protein
VTCPRWSLALLRRVAPPGRVDEVLGDLEETHRRRLARRGRRVAVLLTCVEALDVALSLTRGRMLHALSKQALGLGILRDVRYANRMIAKRPGFSAAVALTLALGIGATTGIFSIINSIVIQPLPYPDSNRLYTVWEQDSLGTGFRLPSYPTFRDWHEESEAFEGLAFVRGTGLTFQTGDQTGMLLAAFVSEDFFPTLRAPALLGRTILAGDYRGTNPNVAVLSYRTWQRVFGGDSAIMGRTISLGNAPFTIVGVMPPAFVYPNWGAVYTDAWLPMPALPPSDRAALGQRDFHADSWVIARLADDVPIEAARSEMDAVARRLATAFPETSARWTRVFFLSVKDFIVGDSRTRLWMLGAAVAGVLLICCVNLAQLYLAQGAARTREFAIRAALGARRGRVLRQLLTETLLLTSIAGALGAALAAWMVHGVRVNAPSGLPRVPEIGVDWSLLVVAVGLTVITAVVFAAVAARRVSSPHVAGFLVERAGTALVRGRRGTLPASLLAAQVAVTVVLLVGAGLLGQTFWRLSVVDPGLDTDGLVLTVIQPPSPAYDEPLAAALLYDRVAESIRQVPGVESVALVNHAPVGNGGLRSRAAIGQAPSGASDDMTVLFEVVSPGYFATMGIPMLQGREFTAEDAEGPAGPLIVSATLARRWGEHPPVGARLGVLKAARTRLDFGEPLVGTVVGVAGDVKHFGLDDDPPAVVYVPYTHNVWSQMTVVARTALPPEQLLRPIEEAIRSVEPAIPLNGPGVGAGTMEQRVRTSYAEQRLTAKLVAAFALVALLLAAVGIYGVLSYTVNLRTREIAIRMALGASATTVQHAVLGRIGLITAAGLFAGVVAALGLTRLVTGLLFQVRPNDPITFVGVAALLLLVAAMAAFMPVRRATTIDPMSALRRGD